MLIGDRLRALRQQKNLSQGDIAERTGMIRCYISRIENNHSVPALETLEKFAQALEIPLYQLFYEGQDPRKPTSNVAKRVGGNFARSPAGKEARLLRSFEQLLGRLDERSRQLLLHVAHRMAKR